MSNELQAAAESILDVLHSVQDCSPDNIVRVFFSEKKALTNIGHLCRRCLMNSKRRYLHL